MKYVAFADQFIAKGCAHAEALASGQTGKLYLDGVKVKVKDAVIEVDDSYVTIEPEITGIGELEIGSTFIVLNRDGKTK